MKLNWGTGIAIVLTAFVGMMAWFAVRAINNPESLVSEDYYQEELAYQGDIDKLARSIGPDRDVRIREVQDTIVLLFPGSDDGRRIHARLSMMCLADDRNDQTREIDTDRSHTYRLPTSAVAKGVYRIRIDWSIGGEERLSERHIVIR